MTENAKSMTKNVLAQPGIGFRSIIVVHVTEQTSFEDVRYQVRCSRYLSPRINLKIVQVQLEALRFEQLVDSPNERISAQHKI